MKGQVTQYLYTILLHKNSYVWLPINKYVVTILNSNGRSKIMDGGEMEDSLK